MVEFVVSNFRGYLHVDNDDEETYALKRCDRSYSRDKSEITHIIEVSQ